MTKNNQWISKFLVQTKLKILLLITHPGVVPKPVRLSFIFETQIEIFLMKPLRFLSLNLQPTQLPLIRY